MAEPVIIRRAEPADGPALMIAVAAIDAETEFLGVPGQPHPWAERPAAELRGLAEQARGVVLLAVTGDGSIVGYLFATLGQFARNRGNLFIAVVGLREAYRGLGIGTRLFEAVEAWACERQVWRLELRVSSLNERGQALYKKRGFAIEGTIRGGVFRRGAWTDDFWMAKLLRLPAARSRRAGRAPLPTIRAPQGAGRAGPAPRIRPMQAGDGAAFHAFDMSMAEVLPFSLKQPSEVASAEAIERDIAANPADPRLWLVATAPARGGDAIVGFAAGNIEFGFRMQHDAFVNVAVLPEWQGRGLGHRLHARIESWALDNEESAAADGIRPGRRTSPAAALPPRSATRPR